MVLFLTAYGLQPSDINRCAWTQPPPEAAAASGSWLTSFKNFLLVVLAVLVRPKA
jgi:hypothetical protein